VPNQPSVNEAATARARISLLWQIGSKPAVDALSVLLVAFLVVAAIVGIAWLHFGR
jgi:hypothetical protein